jgi:hypothetical protein
MMRAAVRYRSLGIPERFHTHAAHYERLWRNIGWDDKQIEEGLKFGVGYQGDGSEADITSRFQDLVTRIDAPDAELSLDVGFGLRDSLTLEGMDALPPLPADTFSAADERRLQEIRTINRNDPSSFDRDRALNDEYLSLLEAKEGDKPVAVAPAASAERQSAQVEQKPQGDRLSQIREIARSDPRGYESNSALQQEQLQLIQASLPAAASIGAASEPTSNQGTTE